MTAPTTSLAPLTVAGRHRPRTQRGSTTAEYAAVTAAGCGFAGVLVTLLNSDFGRALIERILDFFLRMIGL